MVDTSKYDFHFVVATEGYTTAQNRIYVAVQAIKNQSDFLLFIDDDMVFPKNTLDQLLSHDKEIVGVLSYSRVLPLAPTVALMDESGKYISPDTVAEYKIPEELFKCHHLGGGVLLIKMSVFEAIEKPWFHFDMYPEGPMKVGEDAWFCEQAKSKGFDIWCDPTIPIGHLGEFNFAKYAV